MIKYNKKYDKPVKFRFVILDDEDNVIEVLYETNEYNSEWDSKWSNVCYHKVIELNKIYDFDDYENCPNIEIQICCNGVWKFHEDIIDYWFNL